MEKIHQAEKPIDLYKEILSYVTKEGEFVVDQFAGSGNLGIAAVEMKRSCLLIEQDTNTFETMCQNVSLQLQYSH